MRKLYLIVLLFCCVVLSLSSAPTDDALRRYLESERFAYDTVIVTTDGPKKGTFGSIIFREGKFSIQTVGGMEEDGSYTIKGTSIQLHGSKLTRCKLDENSKSLIFTAELNCGGNWIFFPDSTRRAEGSEIQFGNQILVTMKSKAGLLTTPAVFREKPTTKGKPIRCPDGTSPLSSTKPDGSTGPLLSGGFEIIGRTKEKASVGKWNNYWYYILTPFNELGTECSGLVGWVFAEFVRVKD